MWLSHLWFLLLLCVELRCTSATAGVRSVTGEQICFVSGFERAGAGVTQILLMMDLWHGCWQVLVYLSCFTGWKCLALLPDVETAALLSGYRRAWCCFIVPHLSVSLSRCCQQKRHRLRLAATALLLFCQWCHCCTTRFVFSWQH